MQYPVEMELKYKISSRTPRVGMGQTTWMSSREVIFTSDRPIEQGTMLEISIAWPALLHNRVALQLVVEGQITQCEGTQFTARIQRHHFRTRGPWLREENELRPLAAYAGQTQLPSQENVCPR